MQFLRLDTTDKRLILFLFLTFFFTVLSHLALSKKLIPKQSNHKAILKKGCSVQIPFIENRAHVCRIKYYYDDAGNTTSADVTTGAGRTFEHNYHRRRAIFPSEKPRLMKIRIGMKLTSPTT